jgi:hypothetical protein
MEAILLQHIHTIQCHRSCILDNLISLQFYLNVLSRICSDSSAYLMYLLNFLHTVIYCLSNFRVYCHHCIDLLAGDGAKKWIHEKEPWLCFLCDDALPSVCGLITPRPDWMNCNKVCIQLLPVCLSYACCLSTVLCLLMIL